MLIKIVRETLAKGQKLSKGETVSVPDELARQLIQLGRAEKVTAPTTPPVIPPIPQENNDPTPTTVPEEPAADIPETATDSDIYSELLEQNIDEIQAAVEGEDDAEENEEPEEEAAQPPAKAQSKKNKDK